MSIEAQAEIEHLTLRHLTRCMQDGGHADAALVQTELVPFQFPGGTTVVGVLGTIQPVARLARTDRCLR